MTNVLFDAIHFSRRDCAKAALFQPKQFNIMFKKGNNKRGLHVVMLDLSEVLLLLTSLCSLAFNSIKMTPLQLIVTFNIRVTIGPKLGKETLQFCKNQNRTDFFTNLLIQ